jgi:protein required for attachment to host cells
MAESKLWLVVADAGRAAIYSAATPRGSLSEVVDFIDPENRMPEQDLARDRPGRTFDSGGAGRHAMEPSTPPGEVEEARFAQLLADAVDRAKDQDRFEHLGLVAPPRFLGVLRKSLSKDAARRVVLEVDKDLTLEDADGIRAHLPERLFRD